MTRITQMGMPVVTRDGLGYSVCPVLNLEPTLNARHAHTDGQGFSPQIQRDRRLRLLFFVKQSVAALNRWGNLLPRDPIPIWVNLSHLWAPLPSVGVGVKLGHS